MPRLVAYFTGFARGRSSFISFTAVSCTLNMMLAVPLVYFLAEQRRIRSLDSFLAGIAPRYDTRTLAPQGVDALSPLNL